MTKISPKIKKLKELLECKEITKVFHDFLEDYSIIYHMTEIELNSIFDSQIAHRMLYEISNGSSYLTKHCAISYNDLIKYYFNVDDSNKFEIKKMMNSDPYFWKKRPLETHMIQYAASDVIYLPKFFYLVKEKIEKHCYKDLTIESIKNECMKLIDYPKMNLNIMNFNKHSLATNKEIEGLFKNYICNYVFVTLNIGYKGMIQNKKTIEKIIKSHKIGDYLKFHIVK